MPAGGGTIWRRRPARKGTQVANRKGATARADDDTVDRRPYVPGLYRQVLPVACLREISRSPRFAYHGLRDLHDPQAAVEEAEMAALAEQLAAERVAAGTPVEVQWSELKSLPPPFDKLSAPLDKPGVDPVPRYVTIGPDDRVDASESFDADRATYERMRRFPNCDHAYFRASS